MTIKMNDGERKLKLTFTGESFVDGNVPLLTVASKLQNLQNLVFHAVATVKQDSSARRGLWVNKYRNVGELIFKSSHHSNLVIESELISPGQILSEDFDTGQKAIDLIFNVASKLESNENVDDVIKDRQAKSFLLRSFESFCPGPDEDYEIFLENCSTSHTPIKLSKDLRRTLRRQIAGAISLPEREEATIVGVLTKIHVEVGPNMIAVQEQRGREIECFYDESMRDPVANLLAGSQVEVNGVASLNPDGSIKQLDKVIDIEMVSMEPLRLTKFEFESTRFELNEPIFLTIERSEDLWVYSNDDLNLWGIGERRENALNDLNENFFYIWKEFAEEDDKLLDQRAKSIKDKLIRLVKPSRSA